MFNENIRRIAITGVHKSDLVIYLALILQKLKFRVLVCDKTAAGEISCCIRKPAKSMDIIHYLEIDFACSELAALDEAYDYIFYVQDFLVPAETKVQKSIYICDGIRAHLQLLLQELSRLPCLENQSIKSSMMLYRDLYDSCTIKYVEKCCTVIQQMEVKILQHECMDEAGFQRMQFQPLLCLPELSSSMESCLKDIINQMTGLEERSIKHAVRQAKRGKAY